MNLWEAAALGALQGALEFLPISSSGHLLLAEYFLLGGNAAAQLLAFDAALHGGTLLGLVGAMAPELRRLLRGLFASSTGRQEVGVLALASLPAVGAGLLLASFAQQFRSASAVGLMFVFSGLLLLAAEIVARRFARRPAGARAPVLLGGLLQVLALLPGVSRAGAVCAGAMLAGASRTESLRIALLLGIPIIGGAASFGLLGSSALPPLAPLLTAVATAAVVAFFAARALLHLFAKCSFAPFGIYSIVLGVGVLALA